MGNLLCQCAVLWEILGPHETPGRQGLTLEIDGDFREWFAVGPSKPGCCPKAGLDHSSSGAT